MYMVGCGGGSSPTTPTGWKDDIIVNGVALSSTVGSHTSATVYPGTDMSANDLRVFYAVNFTTTNFSQAYWSKYCLTYQLFYKFFAAHSDEYMFNMVTKQEAHGYDVPYVGAGVPPAPIC
jgi:hypothetical protein